MKLILCCRVREFLRPEGFSWGIDSASVFLLQMEKGNPPESGTNGGRRETSLLAGN